MQHRPGDESGEKVRDQVVRDVNRTDKGPELDGELQAHIGRHLKAAYDDILGQSVPDRFVDLLKKLEEKERSGQTDPGERSK